MRITNRIRKKTKTNSRVIDVNQTLGNIDILSEENREIIIVYNDSRFARHQNEV